jgi:hypothetical protein
VTFLPKDAHAKSSSAGSSICSSTMSLLPFFFLSFFLPKDHSSSSGADSSAIGSTPQCSQLSSAGSSSGGGCLCLSVSCVVLPLMAVHVAVVLCCHHLNWSQRLCQVTVVLRADTGLLSAVFQPFRTLSSIRSSSNSSAILQEERIPLGGFG